MSIYIPKCAEYDFKIFFNVGLLDLSNKNYSRKTVKIQKFQSSFFFKCIKSYDLYLEI